MWPRPITSKIFKLSYSFVPSRFPKWLKKSGLKLNCFQSRNNFSDEIKTIFHHFHQNCLHWSKWSNFFERWKFDFQIIGSASRAAVVLKVSYVCQRKKVFLMSTTLKREWCLFCTAWKVSVFAVVLVRIFLHLDWIRTRITPNMALFTKRWSLHKRKERTCALTRRISGLLIYFELLVVLSSGKS